MEMFKDKGLMMEEIFERMFARAQHLDSINRRSLLQFLVDAYQNRMVGQLIITTVEESLLTKFIEVEEVNLISLEHVIARI